MAKKVPVDDKLGYIDYVEIEIEGGVITKVKWDAFNMDPTTENRSAASLSGAYEVSGLDWATQSYNICHALLEWQDPEKLAMKSDGTTEIVPGVTTNISCTRCVSKDEQNPEEIIRLIQNIAWENA